MNNDFNYEEYFIYMEGSFYYYINKLIKKYKENKKLWKEKTIL